MAELFATPPFDSVDEICCVYYSYETSLAELFHGASYLACSSNFLSLRCYHTNETSLQQYFHLML